MIKIDTNEDSDGFVVDVHVAGEAYKLVMQLASILNEIAKKMSSLLRLRSIYI